MREIGCIEIVDLQVGEGVRRSRLLNPMLEGACFLCGGNGNPTFFVGSFCIPADDLCFDWRYYPAKHRPLYSYTVDTESHV